MPGENQGRFSDLSPKEAQKLMRDAVSSGVFRAVAVLWLLGGVLWLAVMLAFGGK